MLTTNTETCMAQVPTLQLFDAFVLQHTFIHNLQALQKTSNEVFI